MTGWHNEKARAPQSGVRLAWLAILCALLLTATGAQPARGAVAPPAAGEQVVATLHAIKDVSATPESGSRTLAAVSDQRPITLTNTTLPVLAHKTDAAGRTWLKVRLPGRELRRKAPPRTGWITAEGVKIATVRWRLVVDLRTRHVLVYRDGRKVRAFKVIVGKPSTPTPRGEFFVEETMRLPAKHVGAPFAIATSARSTVFKEFMGGPGQVALHGVKNVGGKMGTAVSNGCIRMTTSAIMWLASRIKAGVPLTIR